MKFLSLIALTSFVLAVSSADPDDSSSSTAVTDFTTSVGTTAEACEDQTDCSRDKSLCSMSAYQDLMSKVCRKTCGYCGGTVTGNPCLDSIPYCDQWEANGFCENPFYTDATKKKDCAKTCNLCDK